MQPAMIDPIWFPCRHGLAVIITAPTDVQEQLRDLHPQEQAVAATLSAIRRREWSAGRTALRAVLRHQQLIDREPLLSDDRGAPRVPDGAMGSISHKGHWAAALAAPRQPDCTVGIDLELAAASRVDISTRVLTARELVQLAEHDAAQRGLAVSLRFSLKEAIYKAIDPWVRRYVGFRELEVEIAIDGRAHVVLVDARLVAELANLEIEASWMRHRDLWLCTAKTRRVG
jgi:enterobactin synthetase component D